MPPNAILDSGRLSLDQQRTQCAEIQSPSGRDGPGIRHPQTAFILGGRVGDDVGRAFAALVRLAEVVFEGRRGAGTARR